MTDKPILFSGPMVRALLDGLKAQTRRVIKPQPTWESGAWHWSHPRYDNGGGANYFHTPHVTGIMNAWVRAMPYAPGDRLWVREAWSGNHVFRNETPSKRTTFVGDGVPFFHDEIWFWADGSPDYGDWEKPRPSIHMPRWASRLTLIVTDVRVQRVQEIGDKDARAEGVGGYARTEFRTIWDDLNADRGFGWAKNPWVCALTFTVHHQNIDQMEVAA